MDEIDRFLQRLQKLTTAACFPAIYDGFVEADALVQGEDALLGLLRDYAQQLWQNRILLSMTEEKVALFEEMLHLTPGASQSLDDRRQTVTDAVNERFVLNDAKLHETCQVLAPGFTVYERTDPQELTLGVFTEEDDAQGHLPAVGIVDEIRPTVPQNLALYAGVETAFDRSIVISHAHFSALWAGLGVVRHKEARRQYIVVDEETGKIKRGATAPFACQQQIRAAMPMQDSPMIIEQQITSNLVMPDSDFVVVTETEQTLEAYFTDQGSASTSNFEFSFGGYLLYHADGSYIPSDSNHVYTFVKLYDYDGNEVIPPDAFYGIWDNSGMLCAGTAPTPSFFVYKLTYKVTES